MARSLHKKMPLPRFHQKLTFALAIIGLLWGNAARASQAPSPLFDHDSHLFEDTPELAEHEMETFIKQQQARLAEAGLRIYGSYWGDFLANPIGGQNQSAAWIQLIYAGAELDLHKTIGGPPGGSLVASFTDVAGSNLSLEIGNVFAVPQAYLMNTFALYDLYYKQELLDGKITFEIGRMCAGRFFAVLPAMTMVVSAAVNGNPTSLFVNALYPSIGTATWGAHLKVTPTEQYYAEAGVFQASPRNGDPTYHGADFSLRPGDGVIMLAEAGWTPNFSAGNSTPTDGKSKPAPLQLPGIYTFGAYLTNYSFEGFQGGIEKNAYGFYWLAQQMVWRSRVNPLHNFSLWGGVTYAPQDQISVMPVMGMGGLIFQGLIPTRDADNALLNFYTGGFGQSYGDALASAGQERPTVETVIEASYIIQVTPNLQVQPDLQYIIRPAGLSSIPNALVLGFQVSLSF